MLAIDGPEDLTNWLAQTLMMMQTSRLEIRRPPALRLCLVDKRMVNRFNSSRQPISLVCRSLAGPSAAGGLGARPGHRICFGFLVQVGKGAGPLDVVTHDRLQIVAVL